VATPVIDHLGVTDCSIELSYTWQVGAGRQAAIAAFLHRLATDLGNALTSGGDDSSCLRPFLAIRVLGVISLRLMR
jgi:hypothetical protein